MNIIYKNQNMKKAKLCYMDTNNFIVYIKTFTQTLQKMLQQHLILQMIIYKNDNLKEKARE